MSIESQRLASATWSILCEPGDTLAGYLRQTLGVEESLEAVASNQTASDLYRLLPEDQFRAPDFLGTFNSSIESWRLRLRAKSFDVNFNLGFDHLVTPIDECWPLALNDLGTGAPAALWVMGQKTLLCETQTVSVVGARLASSYGLEVTKDIVNLATTKEMIVVSGGALGIDAQAHEVTLKNSGKTIAVMAGGLDRLYPPKNLDLFERIKASGLIVSEMGPRVAPARWRFLMRNRLIAALGRATVVVEAGYKSGSINTAGHANELGRPVGAVPGQITASRSEGCHRLIKEGRAELISTPADFLELLGEKNEIPKLHFSLNSNQRRVMDSFGILGEEYQVNQLAIDSGMSIPECELTLHSLQNLSLVSQSGGNWSRA